jgi:hypothetical protein
MSNSTTVPMRAAAIAKRAQQLKLVFLGSSLSAMALLDPRLPVLQWALARMEVGPNSDAPMTLTDHTGDDLAFSMRAVLTELTTFRGDVVRDELMSGAMLLGAIRLGDMIMNGGYLRQDMPLLQFARHFRHACAHGDRWHFRKGEPRYRAILRDLELTTEMHGQRATWQTVTPRGYVHFLDDLSDYFMAVDNHD